MSINNIYFPVILILSAFTAYVLPYRVRYIWLLICSYLIFLFNDAGVEKYIPAFILMLFITLETYLVALALPKQKSKPIKTVMFVASLLPCLLLFLSFKFSGSFQPDGSIYTPFLNLWYPFTITFFTMNCAAYISDVYTGKLKPEGNLALYALYTSFFPTIATGPASRPGNLLPSLLQPQPFHYKLVFGGAFRVFWGFFKKLVIAENIAIYTKTVFSNIANFTGPELILAFVMFVYQIYIEMTACCDITIGASRMFGIVVDENFRRPFSSKTLPEFWKCWLSSIYRFLRSYIYLPLAGKNRSAKLRLSIAAFITFALGSIWLGINSGYILFAVLSGLCVVASKLLRPYKEKLVLKIPVYRNTYIRSVFQSIFVCIAISLLFLFFLKGYYKIQLKDFFANINYGWFILSNGTFAPRLKQYGITPHLQVIIPGAIILITVIERFAINETSNISDWVRRRGWYFRWPLYYLMAVAILLYGVMNNNSFILQFF